MNGTSYGIPWYVETRVLFYRSDLAKKAGYEAVPTDRQGSRTWPRPCRPRPAPSGASACRPAATGSWQTLMPFAWSDGADLTKDGGKAYNFDSPEMLKATQYYQSYFTDGISNKAPRRPRRPSPTSPAARSRCSSPARG